MSALEIVRPGVLATVQDAGRRGWRRIGVPWAGALDPALLAIANRLVGNAADAPAIECFDGGLELVARDGAARVAVAGEAALEHRSADGARTLAAWRSVTLAEGEALRVLGTGAGRIAMVAVAGLAPPAVLGSASTDARAQLGARPLQPGDRFALPAAPPGPELVLRTPPASDAGPIRAVPGPQAGHFTAAALEAFFRAEFTVTHEADRMGLRLAGPALEHAGAAEILSDATVPGAVQVPGTGRPIVLLADGQTAGGYPKIATVISADLPRLAALRPGATLRFARVTVAEAEDIARAAARALADTLAHVAPLAGETALDLDALYGANLLSGMVDALAPEYRPVK